MKKLLTLSILIGISLSSLSGCSNKTNFSGSNESFGLLGTDGQNKKAGHFMKRGLKFFMKSLDLSNEQKEQVEEIKTSLEKHFENNKPKRTELKNTIKVSFLSETINQEELKTKILNYKSESEEHLNIISESIMKFHNILTPDQKEKLKVKMDKMESRFEKFTKSDKYTEKKNNRIEKRMTKISNELNLSDNQKTSLKELFNLENRKERFENMKKIKSAMRSELENDNPDIDKIKDILRDVRNNMEEKISTKIDKLVKVHDTLNAEQREKLVKIISERKKGFFRRN